MRETLTTEELEKRLRFIATVKADGNAHEGRKGPRWAKETEIEWQAAEAIAVVTAERDALRKALEDEREMGRKMALAITRSRARALLTKETSNG